MKRHEGSHDFEGRVEYSEQASAEWHEAFSDSVELLDMFIRAELPAHKEHGYRKGIAHRSVSYVAEAASQHDGLAEIHHTFSVYHQKVEKGGDSYGVRTTWYPGGQRDFKPIETNYLIVDSYNAETIAETWETDMISGWQTERRMTLYHFSKFLDCINDMMQYMEMESAAEEEAQKRQTN